MSGKKKGIKLKKLNRKTQGFTLIELIVAISIMGVLLIMALPQVQKIQAANRDRKYEAYEKSMIASSKLYIDSYAKDLFGNNNSGCVRIKYSELKSKNLIKDFSSKDISCANDSETYVEVRKVLDEYKYKINMICKDTKKNKQVYKTQEITGSEGSCSLEPDLEAPKITVNPPNTNNKWYNSKNLTVKIKVSDVSGLNSNTTIKYNWYNQTTGKTTITGSHSFKNKKGVEQVSYTLPTSKMPSDAGGIYKITVTPDESKGNGVQDALGNKTLTATEVKEYWIDNQAPSFSGNVTSSDYRFSSKNVKVNLKASDNFTPTNKLKVYISNSGYQTGGSWQNYSSSIKWTLDGDYDGKKRTIYVTIKDLAGNTSNHKFTYTIYKNCTVQLDNGNWYDTSTCSRKCGGGKKEQTQKKKDAYTNAKCPSITQKVDCNLQGCCSKLNYYDGNNCSASCGSGTKNQLAYSYYDGSRCIAYDLSSGGSRCNTGVDCCSKTYTDYGEYGSCEGTCGTGTKYRTVYQKSTYTHEICSQVPRGDSSQCTLPTSCDTTPPNCPTITPSVKAGVWTNQTITFNFRFSSDTVKYVWYTKTKGSSRWEDWRNWGENNKTVTSKSISGEGARKIGIRVYDAAGNNQLCGTDPTYKIDKTAPYTPILRADTMKNIDGTMVKANIYGTCGKDCVAKDSGRKNSVTLQRNNDACYSQLSCNVGSTSTEQGKCLYTKKYPCGGNKWTVQDNTSKAADVSGISSVSELSNTDYNCLNAQSLGDHSVIWYQAVDNAGNKSARLRIDVLNYHMYKKSVLDKYYTKSNYEWVLKSGKSRPKKQNSSCFS